MDSPATPEAAGTAPRPRRLLFAATVALALTAGMVWSALQLSQAPPPVVLYETF